MIEAGKVLHPLYFTCVQPDLRKHGILTRLLQKSIDVARDFHFEWFLAFHNTVTDKRVRIHVYVYPQIS